MSIGNPGNWGITYKILVVTILVSSTVWVVIDYYQSQKLTNVFLKQVYDEVEDGAAADRAQFDLYAQAIFRSAKLIGGQKRFVDYIENMPPINSTQRVEMMHYAQLPLWMPRASIMRTFYRARYALLFDEKGFLRAAYHHHSEHDGGETLPDELLNPVSILRKLSHNQAYMTMIAGAPFLISSETIDSSRGQVTLALISPIDSEFLKESVSIHTHKTLVALIDGANNKIVASSDEEIIPVGSYTDNLKDSYVMIRKSFFDYGASDIGLQLSSFTSTAEAKEITENLLRENKIQRATLVLAMMLTFSLIMLFFVRRIVMLARGVNRLSLELLNRDIEGKNRGDEITILGKQISSFASEISASRNQLQNEVDSATRLAEDLRQLHNEKSESEQRMQEIMDYSPAAICVKDLSGNFIFINKKVSDLYHSSRNEIIGNTLYDILPNELADKINKNDRTVIETERSVKSEEKQSQSDGLHYYLSIKFPLFNEDGEIYAVGGISTDITERKLYENEIKAQQDFTNTILDSAANVIAVLDLDGRFVHFNAAAEQLTGYKSEEVLGRTVWRLLIPDEQQGGVKDAFENLKKGEANVAGEYENEWLTRDGRRRLLHWHNSVLRDARGEISHVMTLGYDITERHQAEIEHARMQNELQQAQKMESLGQLTGGIAHDFNNLLGIINGYANLVCKMYHERGDEKLNQYIDNIKDAGGRATELVAQMLLFSRGEQPDDIPLEFSTLILDEIKMMRSTLPSSIEIMTKIDPDLPSVLMTSIQLHQVLMNLSINARDAMGGSGTLSIQLRWARGLDTESTISHKPIKGDWIELAISDTGSGIAPDIVDNIFNPFFTTKEVGKGTGMGLAVIYRIMEDHDGHILLDSEQGKGSTFRLLFAPMLEENMTNSELTNKPVEIPEGDGSEILVVDDEPMLGFQISELVKIHGYEASFVTDSTEALELFQQAPERFSMIITDQTMPKMTGVELIAKLREIRPELPVIMCSGYSDKIDAKVASEIDISYIKKPVNVERLILEVSSLLGLS